MNDDVGAGDTRSVMPQALEQEVERLRKRESRFDKFDYWRKQAVEHLMAQDPERRFLGWSENQKSIVQTLLMGVDDLADALRRIVMACETDSESRQIAHEALAQYEVVAYSAPASRLPCPAESCCDGYRPGVDVDPNPKCEMCGGTGWLPILDAAVLNPRTDGAGESVFRPFMEAVGDVEPEFMCPCGDFFNVPEDFYEHVHMVHIFDEPSVPNPETDKPITVSHLNPTAPTMRSCGHFWPDDGTAHYCELDGGHRANHRCECGAEPPEPGLALSNRANDD